MTQVVEHPSDKALSSNYSTSQKKEGTVGTARGLFKWNPPEGTRRNSWF
jgi:hypothetical protein